MRLTFLSLYLVIAAIHTFVQEVNPRKAEIFSPEPGEAIRGIVSILGNTDVEGFTSWELSFGYAEDSTGTWFLIHESTQPIKDNLLSEWDTTTITDGIYNLRLTVFLEEGRRTHFTTRDIRIRNYSPIETITPYPTQTQTPLNETPLPSSTPTTIIQYSDTPQPQTPTPFPTNPLIITPEGFSYSLIRGVAGVLAMFIVIGLYITMRKTLGNPSP